MKFLDNAKVYIKSGDGGNGIVSFRHEKFLEYGGPDGGNGGKGGDVIALCCDNLNTLIDYRYHQHFKAKKGTHGSGRKKNGAKGKDIILKLPIGTEILNAETNSLIKLMSFKGQEFTLLKGARGGLGNSCFKSSTNQSPRISTLGCEGEEMWIRLKLYLVSDIGLAGLPNAGKSSLLRSVSSAIPKVAEYPFTTLNPVLGTILKDWSKFVIADIPGLIENAHSGHGLGINFLQHLTKCKIIAHVIDVSQEDPISNYEIIRKEMVKFDKELGEKEEIIVLNKIDLISRSKLNAITKQFANKFNKETISISALTKQYTEKLIDTLYHKIKDHRNTKKDNSNWQP